jgi:hypothetical protein
MNYGKPRKAEELFSSAVKVFRKMLGDQHPNTQNALRGLENVRVKNNRYTPGGKKKSRKKK